ncbi:hypothetical protein WMF04_23970 [Sorangium sp. So ce260]|uniref:hypothetical protein n=1 Tax=Sorangium sp. So ce260 TaxID=3133291 RepID=UPI003F5F8F5F
MAHRVKHVVALDCARRRETARDGARRRDGNARGLIDMLLLSSIDPACGVLRRARRPGDSTDLARGLDGEISLAISKRRLYAGSRRPRSRGESTMKATTFKPQPSVAVAESPPHRPALSRPAPGESPGAAERLGHSLSVLAASQAAPVQCQRNRRRWTDAQRAQSERFWEKKAKKVERQREARESGFLRRIAVKRRNEADGVAQYGMVHSPAGAGTPMPARTGNPVAPDPGATMRYGQVMSRVADFLDPLQPVRSHFNEGGPQFIQNVGHNQDLGGNEMRRVGIDVEPSGHVSRLRPHLNLQTQVNGTPIVDGPLADPHDPVLSADPFDSPDGQHPLRGMQPEEQRKFMERYLRSSGIPVTRQ